MNNKVSLIERAEKQLEQFSHLPEYSQKRGVLDKVVNHLAEMPAQTPEKFDGCLSQAIYLIEKMAEVLKPPSANPEPEDHSSWIWKYSDPVTLLKNRDSDSHHIDTNDLEKIVRYYLTMPWLHCGAIDKLFLSAAIHQEVISYGEGLQSEVFDHSPLFSGALAASKSRKSKVIAWIIVSGKFLFWLLLSVSIGFGAAEFHGWWAGPLAGLGFWVLLKTNWRLSKGEVFDKFFQRGELLDEMTNLLRMLQKPTISPTHLRDRLNATENKGVVWPAYIFPIIERAISRNQFVWD